MIPTILFRYHGCQELFKHLTIPTGVNSLHPTHTRQEQEGIPWGCWLGILNLGPHGFHGTSGTTRPTLWG